MKLLPLLLCLGLVSCVAPRVDPLALFEPAALAWGSIDDDYERGIADGVQDGELAAAAAATLRSEGALLEFALDDKSREKVLVVPWTAMEPWAQRGVQDRLEDVEIGPGVAASLRERIANFTKTINRLKGI